MTVPVKIICTRAPDLIPNLIDTFHASERPIILVPESFTLTTEQALVQSTEKLGFIDTQVFSQTSLIREIQERAGFPKGKIITADGRNMILSLLLMENRGQLAFYKENINHVSMAERLAVQIDDLVEGGFTPNALREAAQGMKQSTLLKAQDIALIWEKYEQEARAQEFLDKQVTWNQAMGLLGTSEIIDGADLLIYGFDNISKNLIDLVLQAHDFAGSITIGIIARTGASDDYIFEHASNSIEWFEHLLKERNIPVEVIEYTNPSSIVNPGIHYIEKNVYALSKDKNPPDLSAIQVYYASNTTVECLHTVQTLVQWRKEGLRWNDMAVAVCDETTIPSMLPEMLMSAGIPFSMRSGTTMMLSEYAQFFVATLRSMRSGYRQEEVLKIVKSRFTPLTDDEMMDLENYARQNGIDHSRWLYPFLDVDDKTARLEELRAQLIDPLESLRKDLSASTCTGRKAAEAIFNYMMNVGAYDTLLRREQELIDAGMLTTADRNRQVWGAVNELLDQLATFAKDKHLSLEELCLMLESSITSKMIKSLPQVADSVIISSPNMFFSSGIRAVALIGLQDQSATPPTSLLTQKECAELLESLQNKEGEEEDKRQIGMTKREWAARKKQDIYQAVASATERLLVSCSSTQPNGKVLPASPVYQNISDLVRKQHPENITGGLMNDGLLPVIPQFAMERLAVMLRQARDQQESFLTKTDEASQLWRNALIQLYHSGKWHSRMQSVLDSLHVRVTSEGIPPELAAVLYRQNRFSVSAIETAGTCMYWAFLAYALRVHQRRDFVFEADSQGTFSHTVLSRFFDEAMKKPTWPTLSDAEVNNILERIISEETSPWKDGPLGKNTSGQYQGREIVRNVSTALGTMVRAIQNIPHFKPVGMEVGFGRPSEASAMRFPAVVLTMDDGREITLSGIIDRVDTVTLEDGRKAVLIYDFKSGDKAVHADSLDAGLQLQLPIYLQAVQQGMPDHVLAGALYQPVKEALVQIKDDDKEVDIKAEIDKVLQSQGIFLNDEAIQKASAPLKVPKRKTTSDVISVLSPEGLQEVMAQGARSACEVVRRMLDGQTTPNPIKEGMRAPCEFCGMRNGCPLDSRLEGGRVRELKNLEEEE